ncbi:hypothetical protein MAMMFC1_03242 [Methylomusa anaerophila]|uniref:Carboxymuconolactone decarboxylase-like domain-containing protein n=1 Tax=Methylomusa anaerophila TaxID=1930071 RepID=A0A348AN99_9FIRM|nr:hypothetical protein MAMMFC1_03242 [Methylomusa anaerophila]
MAITRTGLDYKMREMITFCFLSAQGGCEPQLTSHAAANMRIANDKQFLIKIISQCLPYIGYPRSHRAASGRCGKYSAGSKTLAWSSPRQLVFPSSRESACRR